MHCLCLILACYSRLGLWREQGASGSLCSFLMFFVEAMKTMRLLLKKRLWWKSELKKNEKSSDLFLWKTSIGKRLPLEALAVIEVLEAWFAEAAIKS